MPDIYEQHKAAFPHVAAWVVVDKICDPVATVATISIRYPVKGDRLWAYVHLRGVDMVRGWADGGGYDKTSAAVAEAIMKIPEYPGAKPDGYGAGVNANRKLMRQAVEHMDSSTWTRELERVGLIVLQAV